MLYKQAGSFSDTFIVSKLYQDTLDKYFFWMGTIGNPRMVNRVTFLAQISSLSYIVKNFKLGFLKKGSPKNFKTQDLKWSLSTCKKLLKHFFWDIFLFQDISEDGYFLVHIYQKAKWKLLMIIVMESPIFPYPWKHL